ncbi:hypothetical protein CIW83_03505 [Tissierella sp. P1]|uniref:hypothetical protein n=1 Tax=Tissierella sp. P1 TaxID=1280483 RepID=UPI000BA08EC1|nr:hypothetical protein [Tissierella sp. P1]MDU5080576.1 hypothetical protein [Bacillota bacterium]OZV13620.1 hypothetical protein CIW83_03505 [Tissierella sp. P1]
MKNKLKQDRKRWLFSGVVWSFIFLVKLSKEGLTLYPIINGITGVLCFANAYIRHKEIIKNDED